MLLFAVSNVGLNLYKWQVSDAVHGRNQLAISLCKYWLGEDTVLSQLLPFSFVSIEPHCGLPLDEKSHWLELLEEWDFLKNLLSHSIFNILIIGQEIGDLLLIFSNTNKTILTKYLDSSVIFGRIFILFEHQVRIWILVDLERYEMLLLVSFLINLFEKIDDLFRRLWLLLHNVPIAKEWNLRCLRFCYNRTSLLIKLTRCGSGSQNRILIMVISCSPGHVRSFSRHRLVFELLYG